MAAKVKLRIWWLVVSDKSIHYEVCHTEAEALEICKIWNDKYTSLAPYRAVKVREVRAGQ